MHKGGILINTFIYFEDLVANALIQKIECGGDRFVTKSELQTYGKNIVKWWLKNLNLRVTILDSHYYVNRLLLDYPDYFSGNSTRNGEMTIWLCDDKRTDDLRKTFRSYLSVDMLLCFTQASSWKSSNAQKATGTTSEPGKVKRKMEWIKVSPKTMPPAMEPVIVTVVGENGPEILKNAVWDPTEGSWGQDDGADCIVYLDDNLPVTHWMPYPKPAKE